MRYLYGKGLLAGVMTFKNKVTAGGIDCGVHWHIAGWDWLLKV